MTRMCPWFWLAKRRNTSPVRYSVTMSLPIIAHYGCRNNKRFTVKFAIIIDLKIICHVRIGITPSKTTVYTEFYHGLRLLLKPWFGQGLWGSKLTKWRVLIHKWFNIIFYNGKNISCGDSSRAIIFVNSEFRAENFFGLHVLVAEQSETWVVLMFIWVFTSLSTLCRLYQDE